MRFGVLGRLEVRIADEPVPLGTRQQRLLLAVLLRAAGRPVSRDELLRVIWGAAPPRSASTNLRVYVSRLRRILDAPDRILRTGAGYLLTVDPQEWDAGRFERLTDAGQRLVYGGDLRRGAAQLRAALALWRGPAFAGFEDVGPLCDEARRLEERRLGAREQLYDAELALGRHAGLLTELSAAVAEHPYRERFRGQLMIALHRCGRQAEALQAYRSGREAMLDGLGQEPGAELRRLRRLILRGAPTVSAPAVPLVRRSLATQERIRLAALEREVRALRQRTQLLSRRLDSRHN